MSRKLTILALAIAGLHVCEVVTLGTTPLGSSAAKLLGALASALAGVMCFGAFRRARGVSRPFWLLVGIGVASESVIDLVFAYYEGWLHVAPTAVAGVLILTLLRPMRPMFFAMALFLDPKKDSSRLDLEALIDFTQIIIVFFFTYLWLYYIPTHSPGHSVGLAAGLLQGLWVELTQRVAIIVLAIVQMARASRPQIRALYRNFLFYLAWYLCAEGVAVYFWIVRNVPSGTLLDLVWTLGFLGVAVWAACWNPATEEPTEGSVRRIRIRELMVTNATFALAPLIVLLQVTQSGPQWWLLRYSLLGASMLCFAARLGIGEYRQSLQLESLQQHKLTIEAAREDLHAQKALLAEELTELTRAEAEIVALNQSLINAHEEERARIARELHDDLSQQIAALGISLSNIKRQIPEDPQEAGEQVERAYQRLMQVAEGLRHLSHELHPALLENLGLTAALRSYCTEFKALTKVSLTVEANDSFVDLPYLSALGIFRIAQEALQNVRKHSAARESGVHLTRSDALARLRVWDDGMGFDPSELSSEAGLGLVSMRERARLLGGTFSIESSKGRGTTIIAEIPIDPSCASSAGSHE
jgi:signal transduction histidine kinase